MEAPEKTTPMLSQYLEIKNHYKSYVLFYRLGDFYEMFLEEAERISKVLELTLTSRAGTPMCGVPHHSSEVYVKRLVEKGYKVAICEQIGDPKDGKGIVERAVVRIVTAGTLIEDSMLDEGRNNFIACFYAESGSCGAVFADLSTGELHVPAIRENLIGNNAETALINEIARYMPVEILFNTEFLNYKNVSGFIKKRLNNCVGDVLEDKFFSACYNDILKQQLKADSFETIGMNGMICAQKALIGLLGYFTETQKLDVSRFVNVKVHAEAEFMELGLAARRNLELTETMRGKEKKGSLLWVIDKTKTSMGRRKIRHFIERPLTNHAEIKMRHDAVYELTNDIIKLGETRDSLTGIYDLERLMTRIVYKAASPRDVFALGQTCAEIPILKNNIKTLRSKLMVKLNSQISELGDITDLVDSAIKSEPPAFTKDGGYIKDGFNEELDRLRKITGDNREILAQIEERERADTGIKNLKLGYNRVTGYYIEVSKSNVSSVPSRYIRKQTLSNGERYITDELKNIENEILSAGDKIISLEAEIFGEIRSFLVQKLDEVQQTAEAISEVDVLCGFACCALENDYVKPEITLENVIAIKDGRHPVVEKMLGGEPFTPNDTYLDINENRMHIITGPNMSGKSTYMRQVAIITLMAQIGCFVPAKTARIGVVDKIFTRVGASDDLSAGQSTFMVEMTEVAEILKEATDKSLVILDEIGRGTSTFDGMSIAKAVAEYINSKAVGCKTLFATHYHELTSLERNNKGIRNYGVSVMKKGDEIQFLHKIIEGGINDSYGIEVAKLAGLPNRVIANAKETLAALERNSKIELETELAEYEKETPQIDFNILSREKVINIIKSIDVNALTPLEALQTLSELKKEL